MGKMDGFLLYDRQDNKTVSPLERIKNFNEFHVQISDSERKKQAARCMDCGVPYCQSALKLKGMVTGCPLHNLIPEWNDEVYKDNLNHALSRLLKMSSFPEFTSRVCPALCEKACLNGLNGHPVTIHENEYYIIESAFEKGLVKPQIPSVRTDKSVAVIGSGPAGLALADRLNKRGHNVQVFERQDRIGGLLMYGIPNMKLDKSVIERRKRLMEQEGIIFHTGIDITKKEADVLLKDYDVVVLACGAKKPRSLNVEGINNTDGVYYAVDFLTSSTKSLLDNDLKEGTYISAKDKNVVIVGGGDTGNDCVGTCIRHGCKSITQLEMMPKPLIDRGSDNPWPEWPKVLKTDYGQQEAIALFGKDPRIFETTVKKLITEDKKLKEIEIVQTKFIDGKLTEIEGSQKLIPCDLLIIAAGFVGFEDYVKEAFDIETTSRNTALTKEGSYQTSNDKIFTCGDMHKGQSLVVWAIDEGRRCAKEVDEYLMGYTNLE